MNCMTLCIFIQNSQISTKSPSEHAKQKSKENWKVCNRKKKINKRNCNGKLEKVEIRGSSCLWILWGNRAEKCFGEGKRNLQSKLRDFASIFFFLPCRPLLFGCCCCCWFLATFNLGLGETRRKIENQTDGENQLMSSWKALDDKLFLSSANCWLKSFA